MTLKQFQNRLLKDVQKEAVRVAGAAIGKGLAQAKLQSSGPLKARDRRQMDYPYATRHGSPLVPLLPINKDKGGFYDDWGSSTPTRQDDQATARLFNYNHVAKYLRDGTPKMFARPIQDHLREYVQAEAVKEAEFSFRMIARRYR